MSKSKNNPPPARQHKFSKLTDGFKTAKKGTAWKDQLANARPQVSITLPRVKFLETEEGKDA